jgi:excisionase family DNA binding protein
MVKWMSKGGLKLLFAPRVWVDSCNQVDGILDPVSEGAAALLDEFEHHGRNPNPLRKLGLGQSRDPPGVVQGMDFLGDTSWTRFHLTKVTSNHYPSSSNMIGLSENHSSQEKPSWDHAYLTREQVAEYLQISERKVSDMTTKGELPAVKLGTGRNASIRYRRSAVDEALLKMQIN